MFSWEYPPHVVGGLGKHVRELFPALAAAGVEVHVITPNLHGALAEEEVAPNATVHRVPIPDMSQDGNSFVSWAQTSNSSLERKGRDLQREFGRIDLIHAHDWLVAYSAVALKYATRTPLVATFHATERGRGEGSLTGDQALAINGTEWWLTYEAWRVITVSRFMANQISQYFGIPVDKIDVINNGMTLPSSRPLAGEERQSFRLRFAEDGEQIVFYVGRIVHEKGIHLLIDAAPRILAQRPATKFVIAGTGDQLEALRRRAGELGVWDRFYFTGFIPDQDRDRLYQVADVAVFPSLYEPFGIVALEAMAYRCPLVVAATGGLVEVVKLHETGLTFHPGSPDSLAWAVVETLQRPDWARARAENGFREVQQHYGWDRVASQTLDVYRRVQQEWERSEWASSRYQPAL